MPTHTFRLAFHSGNPDAGDLPGSLAYVTFGTHSTHARTGDVLISRQCHGPEEFRAEIKRLKSELTKLEDEGVEKFASYSQSLSESD